MTQRQYTYQSSGGGFNIMPIIIGVLFLVGLYYIAKIAFNLLYYAAPVLLIITLLIDYHVVINYGKWIFRMLQKNPLAGIGMILLTLVGFPIVSFFLFGKALLKKKIKDVQKEYEVRTQGEYTEYEEVQPQENLIELPPIKEKTKQTKSNSNEYEDLFDE